MISEQKQNSISFQAYTLGQTVLKYQVPLEVFNTINKIYETDYFNLMPANKQLAGKIKKEHSLFFKGKGEDITQNVLPLTTLLWFEKIFSHYLEHTLRFHKHKKQIASIWVNEMKEHEYNPIHVHQGTLFTGLSSVMILKLPESFGVEYSTQLLQGDFYVFPYDLRHCVYPFNGPGFRRTLSCNCDVDYNPIINRGRE